jgi:hypothetical protein
VIGRLCGVIHERRDERYVDHPLEDLLRQRIFQIALGYEDANDCDDLRRDPGLKAACDRFPISGQDLGSQPTMTRLENMVTRSDLYRMAQALVDTFIASYEHEPEVLILDIDDTDDTTHGAQQQSLFNGYFGEHCFMPLQSYEGQSGKLITTLLRPGRRPSGEEIVRILKRLIPYLKKAWPDVEIFLRGDSHFSTPEVHDFCEEEAVYYALGQTGNNVLKTKVLPLLLQAKELYQVRRAYNLEADEKKKIRLFTSFL